jgi:asparaginyl-tRNA synthetase
MSASHGRLPHGTRLVELANRADDMMDQWTALSRVRSALLQGASRHYRADEVLEVRVPVLVDITGACETVSNVLAVEEMPACVLTQTGQLALESALEHADAVWCHTGSFRREVVDGRHLQEFELIEEEMSRRHPLVRDRGSVGDSDLFALLLERITAVVKAMLAQLLDDCLEETEALGGDARYLEKTVTEGFARITYREALSVLGLDPTSHWGRDLSRADEERILAELAADADQQRPTFITRFPQGMKFFNMKTDREDPDTVLSVDLLLPGIGEAVGGAVREDDSERLQERFERLMLPRLLERPRATGASAAEPFARYFATVAGGRVAPHAGYGLGLERLLSFVLRQPDIRRVSMPWILSPAGAERKSA